VHIIKRVKTLDGKVLYENKYEDSKRVLQPETAGMMNQMMTRTLTEGTAKKAQFGVPAAGKTGTSQSFRDAWFIGYTASLTTGVWFGNDDNSPTNKVTGGSLPALAWKEFMTAAHQGVASASLPGMGASVAKAEPATIKDIIAAPVPRLVEKPKKPAPVSDERAPASKLVEKPKKLAPMSSDSAQAEPKKLLPLPASPERTGSTKRPVPKADVGKRVKQKETTIMDLIQGN
jgi:penicillin-binding protein 1A